MIVYCLFEGEEYDGSALLSVHTTEDSAVRSAELLIESYENKRNELVDDPGEKPYAYFLVEPYSDAVLKEWSDAHGSFVIIEKHEVLQ